MIPSNDFQQIFTAAAESGLGDVNLLRSCYKENKNLQPSPQYVLLEPRRASRQYEEELEHIAKLVEYGSKVAAREGLLSDKFGTVMSAVHQQTLHALECARQVANGNANSPTLRQHFHHAPPPPAISNFVKSPHHHFTPSSSATSPHHSKSKPSASAMFNSHSAKHAHPSSEQSPRRSKANRLMHQASLQQGPTQQKITMPRQTSVTTNYALLQPPVDRMLCFVRQFEGVNFNNVCITKFFDVTPTIMNEHESTGANSSISSTTTLTPTTGTVSKPLASSQQAKPLFAPCAQNDIQQLIEDVILGLQKGNVHYFNISWSPPESNSSLQTRTYTLPEHYIERFGETVLKTVKRSIDSQLEQSKNSLLGSLMPDNTYEYSTEIVREAHSHLSNFRRVMGALGMAQAIESDFANLLQIRELLVQNKTDEVQGLGRSGRHQPIIVTGCQGAGKSTLLAQVFTYAPEWLAETSERDLAIRIVRQCGQSLSSNFASELLRSLCLQIAIAYGFDTQLNRCSEAHELSELAICLQELLKMIETTPGANSSDLLIILDDLHHLQSALQSSALLGWMPWNLPANVHFICSVALESESVLSILKSRISIDNFVRLDDCTLNTVPNESSTATSNGQDKSVPRGHQIFSMVQCKLRDEKRTLTLQQWEFVRERLRNETPAATDRSNTTERVHEELTPLFANMLASSVLSNWESFYVPDYLPTTVEEIVSSILDDIEECIPYALVRRICSYLTCTKYGLRETELYNLAHETLTCQVWPAFNCFKMNTAAADSGSTPDPSESPRSTSSTWLLMKAKMKHLLKEYFVQGHLYLHWRSPRVANAVKNRYLIDIQQIRATHQELALAFYSSFTELNTPDKKVEPVREADELWYHLLYSGNKEQLKSYALLNIKFLMTIVEGVSVCYLKCILDAVRSQILDWDIELLYGMLKQSVHVITQDPSQLPVEALLWLVPFVCAPNASVSLYQVINHVGNNSNNSSIAAPSATTSRPLPANSTHSQVTTNSCGPESCTANPSSYLQEFLRQSYKTCMEFRKSLLCPNNVWLNLPIPPQVTMITSPWQSITRAVTTPDGQTLIVAVAKMLHFFHLPTKTVLKSLDGMDSGVNNDLIPCCNVFQQAINQ